MRTYHRRVLSLSVAVFLGFVAVGRAVPLLTNCLVRIHASPVLQANGWAEFVYRVENPDPEPVVVEVYLRPRQHETAVFRKRFRVEPGAYVQGREPITAAATLEYVAECLVDGEPVGRDEIFCTYSDPRVAPRVTILNDSPDFANFSIPAKSRYVREPVSTISVRAGAAPGTRLLYSDARMVAIACPEYGHMTSLQFEAILDYVHAGGTLVFIRPEGILGAVDTPLAELLPCMPVGQRKIESFPELDALGRAFHDSVAGPGDAPREVFGNGREIPFVECVPLADTVTTLAFGEFPAVCWRRVGLGKVGMVAFDACGDGLIDSACIMPLWRHLLAESPQPFSLRDHTSNSLLPAMLSRLTGYSVPGVRTVGTVLCAYLLAAGLVLVTGYRIGRHGTAWMMTAVLGVCVTAGVFRAAFRGAAERPPASAAGLDFELHSATRASGLSVVNLFSTADLRPSPFTDSADCLLRGLPPVSRGGAKQVGEPPLIVHREGERTTAPEVYLRALKPRSLAAEYTPAVVPIPELPVLELTADEPRLAEWTIPSGFHSEEDPQALILLPGGILTVACRGGVVAGTAGDPSAWHADPLLSDLQTYLLQAHVPSPSLILVASRPGGPGAAPPVLEEFTAGGYGMKVVPLIPRAVPGTILIPPEMVAVKPADNNVWLIADGRGGWEPGFLRRDEAFLAFDAFLPPDFAGFVPEDAEVTVGFSNAGGNIDIEAGLVRSVPLESVPDREMVYSRLWQDAARSTSGVGSRFVFPELGERALRAPMSGELRILLRLSQRRVLNDPMAIERANRWQLTGIRLQLKGASREKPEPATGPEA